MDSAILPELGAASAIRFIEDSFVTNRARFTTVSYVEGEIANMMTRTMSRTVLATVLEVAP